MRAGEGPLTLTLTSNPNPTLREEGFSGFTFLARPGGGGRLGGGMGLWELPGRGSFPWFSRRV